MGYTNSPLVNYKLLSPCNSGARTHRIDRITPHCVVGQASVEGLGTLFQNYQRQTSSNYGIGADGRIGLYVDERNRSWCSSSNANDQRAITIECASSTYAPYEMNAAVYNSLIKLCVDICKRNGIKKLLWLGSKEKTLAYTPKDGEAVLTAHRWFANKSCPGEWLYSRFGDLAVRVTRELATNDSDKSLYRVQIGAFSDYKNAEKYVEKAKEKGFDAVVREETVYAVQCGAFSDLDNAENFTEDLQSAGFNAIIKEA